MGTTLYEVSQLLTKFSYLKGFVDPEWIDGKPGQPGPGPIFREGSLDHVLASLVRRSALKLSDKRSGATAMELGKALAVRAAENLVQSWEEGDDLCPPWIYKFPVPPRPDPWRAIEQIFGPIDPIPWIDQAGAAVQDLMLAHGLRMAASITTSAEIGPRLADLGRSVAGDRLSDVFENRCGNVPRKFPIPIGPRRE